MEGKPIFQEGNLHFCLFYFSLQTIYSSAVSLKKIKLNISLISKISRFLITAGGTQVSVRRTIDLAVVHEYKVLLTLNLAKNFRRLKVQSVQYVLTKTTEYCLFQL